MGLPTHYRRSIDGVVATVTQHALYCTAPQREFTRHFESVPREQRNLELSKRRIGIAVQEARVRAICLYCWMPSPACLCNLVPNISEALMKAGCVPVFIFHAEEFLRRSNSGHIAAMMFDAPVIVDGLETHNEVLSKFGSLHPHNYFVENASETAPFVPAILFPAPDAVELSVAVKEVVTDEKHLILGLLDGTWNQGAAMNRRLTSDVRRTIINIPSTYVSLFAPIREQTRSTGVSTLEATVMGVVSVIGVQCGEVLAQQVETQCFSMMKIFVDVVRQQKHMDPVYPEVSQGVIDSIQGDLNRYNAKRHRDVVSAKENATMSQRADSTAPVWARYAPVARYCYCCDTFVGFLTMDVHVAGIKHQENFTKRGSWWPSDAAKAAQRFRSNSDDDEIVPSSHAQPCAE
jgi:DTW domain-containing protein YfiP